jgi:putative SOS response-associated peptidase YedK
MCGRYALELTDTFKDRFHITNTVPDMPSRYNIAPSQVLPVVVGHSPNRVALMHWGLSRFWSKTGKGGVINARAETLHKKRLFMHLLATQRCLVPATGFYEWQRTSEGKIPYHIRLQAPAYFAFAGLYDTWSAPDGEQLHTYTIITTVANALVAAIHTRMPVILQHADEATWLNPDITAPERLMPLLGPYPAEQMTAYRVGQAVGNPRIDTPELIQPVPQEKA